MNIERLAEEIRVAMGLRLVGNGVDPTHGHISTTHKNAGLPFGRLFLSDGTVIEVDRCPMCEADVLRSDAHDCCEVVLYGADAIEETGSGRPHISRFADARLTGPRQTQLVAIVGAHSGQ